MATHTFRRLIDTLFPVGDPKAKKRTSELIATGLVALRTARDEKGVATDATTMVPSRLELRMAQGRYDELAEMGALRDVEFYFNDELMKDIASRRLRTFGDQPVWVTIAADTALQPNEIYAIVLAPKAAGERIASAQPAGYDDRTGVLGDIVPDLPAAPPAPRYVLSMLVAGTRAVVELHGTRWIIGRRGSSGHAVTEGCIKIDLDFPPTVSREQARIDLIGGDRLSVERIGKAPMRLASGEVLAVGERRLVSLGAAIFIDDCEIVVRMNDEL